MLTFVIECFVGLVAIVIILKIMAIFIDSNIDDDKKY